MTSSQLSPMTLIQLRGIARDCWISSDADPEIAETAFTQRYPGVEQRQAFYDLTQHWIDRRIDEPSVVMTQEEATILGIGEAD